MAARRVTLAALLLSVVALAGGADQASALPDLASRRPVGTLIVFSDDQRNDLFYYAPPELQLATGADGRPDLSLLEMRYSGNATSRDRGLIVHKTLLTMRIRIPAAERAELDRVARDLGTAGRPPELRPLPIRRIESALVYASIGGPDTAARVVPGGRFQGSGATGDAFWSERVFTVGLDSLTAQAMHGALASGQLALSLAYAFVADGRVAPEPFGSVDGPPELAAELERQLQAAGRDSAARDSTTRRVVRAGAIRIGVDLKAWPEVVRRVDVEGRMPSGFAALDVYCFDFRDGRRPDLIEKTVEIEAESVGGRPVRQLVTFARAHPDVYSTGLRFPVAVRLDRPYRYRVLEFRPDGTSSTGPWAQGRDWVALLDLTTPAAPKTGVRAIR
jgi:hypothetical protein